MSDGGNSGHNKEDRVISEYSFIERSHNTMSVYVSIYIIYVYILLAVRSSLLLVSFFGKKKKKTKRADSRRFPQETTDEKRSTEKV